MWEQSHAMRSELRGHTLLWVQVLTLATIVVLVRFLWQSHKGFSLWDEGFLWYGVQRVMRGEVPILDFKAYDPGRYYWSAGLMSLWGGGDGIMALRRSVAVFQVLGLGVGTYLIARSANGLVRREPPVLQPSNVRLWRTENLLYLLLCAITIVAWMYPRHKLFNSTLGIVLIGVLAWWVHHPSRRRYFIAGIGIGLIAVFGRNYGVYGAIGSLGVMIWLAIKRQKDCPGFFKGGFLWTGGVIVGYLPLLLMMLLVPGFAAAVWGTIRYLFVQHATNIPLPVPWPWRVSFTHTDVIGAARQVQVGLYFIAIALGGVVAVAWVVWRKIREKPVTPVVVASAFLALPYAQYAYSRADVSHLAQSIFALIIGSLALLATKPAKVKWPLAVLLCGSTMWIMTGYQPGWRCQSSSQCVDVEVSGSTLQVPASTAYNIHLIRQLAAQYAADGESFLVVPFWPGAYALLGRRSPTWEIYALRPRSMAFQEAEIDRIKAAQPAFVLVLDWPLDGKDALRFRNTHPLIFQFIEQHYDPLRSPKAGYLLYKANRHPS